MIFRFTLCAVFLHVISLASTGYEKITGDCIADISCAKAIALEKYHLQPRYASYPDYNKVVYFYNSNGQNIGRVGWEPSRWYIHGCGADGHFNYLTIRQTTDQERTWTVSNCVNLAGVETHIVKEHQSSLTVTCTITSNIEIVSTDLTWTIGSTEKKIDDENVSWDSDKKETKLTLSPPPTETRTYGCFYVGAETNSTVTVHVLGFTKSPTSTHILKDSTGILTCTLPTSKYDVSVQWYKDDHVMGSAATDTSSTTRVAAAGSYKCVATYNALEDFLGGQVTSDVATVQVLQFVSVSESVSILKGQTSSLSCTIPNAPYSVRVNWYRSSDETLVKECESDYANAEYSSTYEASVADEFYCKATYTAKDEFKGGDLNSEKITVTVIDFIVNPVTADIGIGIQYELTCKLGIADFDGEFSWFKDEVEIAGTQLEIKAKQENILSYTVEGDKANTGVYFCRAVYNTQTGLIAGFIDSAKATVTVAGCTGLSTQWTSTLETTTQFPVNPGTVVEVTCSETGAINSGSNEMTCASGTGFTYDDEIPYCVIPGKLTFLRCR